MPVEYKLPFVRSMSWSLPITGSWQYSYERNADPVDIGRQPGADSYINAAAGGGNVEIRAWGDVEYQTDEIGAPLLNEPYLYKYGAYVRVTGGTYDGLVYVYDSVVVAEGDSGTVVYSLPADAALSVSVSNCQLWMIVEGTGYPGGVLDHPGQSISFQWRTTEASTISVSCCGATSSGPLSPGQPVHAAWSAACSVGAARGGGVGCSVSCSSGPATYSIPSLSQGPATGTPYAGTSGTASTPCSVSFTNDNDDPRFAGCGIFAAGDITYDIDIAVRAMKTGYPDTLHAYVGGHVGTNPVSVSGGAGSAGGTQKNYRWSWGMPGNAGVSEINEHAALSVGLSNGDLLASGDESALTRCPFRGKSYSGLSVTLGNFTCDDGSSVGTPTNGWTSTGGGPVFTGSGAIISPTAQGLIRKWATPISCLAHRYLRIRARSAGGANVPLKVTIPAVSDDIGDYSLELFGGGSTERTDVRDQEPTPDKTWQVQTGADDEWVDIDIDLCAPHNVTATTDDWDSRWPLPTRMPAYSGVWRMKELRIEGTGSGGAIPSGGHLEIDSIALVVKDTSSVKWDWMPVGYPQTGHYEYGQYVMDGDGWPQHYKPDEEFDAGSFSTYRIRRFVLGRADGHQGPEEADISYTNTDTSVGRTTSVNHYSIAGLAAQLDAADVTDLGTIKRYPGISVSINAPVASDADPYYHRDQPATWLHGGGLYYGGPGVGWVSGLDRSGSAMAQPLYDTILLLPGLGDVFGHGGSDGYTTPLKAGQTLRGGAHGLLIDSSNAPKASETATAQEGASVRGSGVSDATGYYRTGDPWLHASETTRSGTVSVGSRTGGTQFYSRKRSRLSFRVTSTASLGAALAYQRGGGVMTYGLADDSGAWLVSRDTTDDSVMVSSGVLTGVREIASMSYHSTTGELYMVTRRTDAAGGGWGVLVSKDWGATRTGIMTLDSSFTSAKVVEDTSRGCFVMVATIASDTNLIYDSVQDGTAFTLIANAASQTPRGDVLDLAYDQRRGRITGLFSRAGETQTWVSDDVGRSWTRLA